MVLKLRSIALAFLFLTSCAIAQRNSNYSKHTVNTGDTSFFYYKSDMKSKSMVLLFHDWFGISDLSYELAEKLNKEGYDVIIMDLYKGKKATTNQEARQLMNSIDQANVWDYIDEVFLESRKKYEKLFLWGFSLGTTPASNVAIKHNDKVDGLILFYGNVTQDEEMLAKMDFPALMVMGGKDNPMGAINFFKSVNKNTGTAQLFIYPNAQHAFAQKLFNNGASFDAKATAASLNVAFHFLDQNNWLVWTVLIQTIAMFHGIVELEF